MTTHLNAVDTASEEAAYAISLALKTHLVGQGWPRRVAESVKIIRTASGFDVDFEGENADEAQTLEYGNEYRRPTGSVRKFLRNESLLYQLYFDRLEENLGEIL